MYTKLNFKLENIDYARLKGNFFEGYGDTFKQFKIKDLNYLESIIESKIQFDIIPHWVTCCEIRDYGATPHVDHNTVALNYYIEASGYVTAFWATKSNASGKSADQLISETGKTRTNDVKTYDFKELKIIDKFKANAHEAYLLDIKQIHSASKMNSDDKVRTMIRWAWDKYNFETILNSIKLLD